MTNAFPASLGKGVFIVHRRDDRGGAEFLLRRIGRLEKWTLRYAVVGVVFLAMAGMAGTEGMLRRTIYTDGLYQPYMQVAMVGALLTVVGFGAFLVNVLWTLGWTNTLGLILPDKWLQTRFRPAPV